MAGSCWYSGLHIFSWNALWTCNTVHTCPKVSARSYDISIPLGKAVTPLSPLCRWQRHWAAATLQHKKMVTIAFHIKPEQNAFHTEKILSTSINKMSCVRLARCRWNPFQLIPNQVYDFLDTKPFGDWLTSQEIATKVFCVKPCP